MLRFKILLIIFLFVYINPAKSGEVDLFLSVDIDASTNVIFNQTTKFSITIHNNGPDAAGIESTSNFPVAALSSVIYQDDSGYLDIYIRQDFSVVQECFFILINISAPPGGVHSYAFDIGFPVIPANSSITCYGTYHIGFEYGSRELTFETFSSLDTDLNPDNDTSEILTFTIQPKVIPTLNIYAILTLLLLVLVFGKSRFNQ